LGEFWDRYIYNRVSRAYTEIYKKTRWVDRGREIEER
jgi:hypothetical protein